MSDEPTLTPEQERDEALGYLMNIVNAWRSVNRYKSCITLHTVAERLRRQEVLEAALEEGRRHLEAVQWM
jgi:hypothetical protein